MTGAGNKTLGKRPRASPSKDIQTSSILAAPRKRKKQEIELYIEDHYEIKVKPLVTAEAERRAQVEGQPLSKSEKFKMFKAVTKDTFDKEDQSIKDAIAAKALAQPSPLPAQNLEDDAGRTPEQLLRYDNLVAHGSRYYSD